MEWVLANSGSPALFVELLRQSPVDGNGWMFTSTRQREWGTQTFNLVPRDQYDGILFVDEVRPPSYVPREVQ